VAVSEQLSQLNAQMADLSSRYTPNHPDVRSIKEKIAAAELLKQRLEADAASGKLHSAVAGADKHDSSRVPQAGNQLGGSGPKIAYREREIKKLERQIETYQGHLNMTPLREQQLAEITRDYSQAKTSYESLLAKKNQSEMASSLEKRQEGELFRVIDPPNLPQKPYKPDHLTFSLLGLAFGTLLALAVTAVVETIDVRVYHERDLREIISAPILGGIPLLLSESEKREAHWYQQMETVAAAALLVAIPAMTLLAYYRN
jgi:uncharacterized protein involved in exopolysaccharide biosynthesis